MYMFQPYSRTGLSANDSGGTGWSLPLRPADDSGLQHSLVFTYLKGCGTTRGVHPWHSIPRDGP